MSKYYGSVGYAVTEEDSPGVWKEKIIERNYQGDITRNTRRLQNNDNRNDDVEISNEISIVGDQFAYENTFAMRYITFMGAKWKISTVEVQRPRLILTVGGVYNGESEES